MSDAVLNKLVERLESVTKRLESIEGKVGGGGGGSSAGGAAGGAGDDSASVAAFDALVSENLDKFTAASPAIHADVGEAAAKFNAAVAEMRKLLSVAAVSAAPSDADLPNVLKPLSTAIQDLTAFRDSKGKPSPVFDHLSTLSEGVACFSWVAIKPAPGPYVTQTRAGSEFYSNKLLKQARDNSDDNLKAWVTGVNGFLKGLEGFIKDHHRTGLTYAGKGNAASAIGSAPAAKPAAAAAPAKKPAAAGGARPSLGFAAELNKGNIGAAGFGLKKVSKDQMTHKNPALRAGGKVTEAPAAKKPVRRGVPNAEKLVALQGNKWVVEGQDGDTVTLGDGVESKHTVYIYANFNATIHITKKVNQVTIDSSKKVNLIVTDVISGIETINCSSVNIQVVNTCPTVQLDKVSGGNVVLSKESLATQIITSKCDAVNVSFPVEGQDDPKEEPIDEQFVSVIKDGKLHTEAVDHSD
jgi:adenylyl cyclase-associated protein